MSSNVMQDFLKVAGEKQEINAFQLCQLLSDHLRADGHIEMKRQEYVESMQTNTDDMAQILIASLLKLLCMTVCKSNVNDSISHHEHEPLTTISTNDGNTYSVAFSREVCKSLLALYDADFSGKLGLAEFQYLWRDTNEWVKVFLQHDKDGTKTLSGFELREALNSAGYTVNNHTLNLLMIRYGDNGHLGLEDFIISVVKLRHMIKSFKKHLKSESHEEAHYTMHSFLDDTIYS